MFALFCFIPPQCGHINIVYFWLVGLALYMLASFCWTYSIITSVALLVAFPLYLPDEIEDKKVSWHNDKTGMNVSALRACLLECSTCDLLANNKKVALCSSGSSQHSPTPLGRLVRDWIQHSTSSKLQWDVSSRPVTRVSAVLKPLHQRHEKKREGKWTRIYRASLHVH